MTKTEVLRRVWTEEERKRPRNRFQPIGRGKWSRKCHWRISQRVNMAPGEVTQGVVTSLRKKI